MRFLHAAHVSLFATHARPLDSRQRTSRHADRRGSISIFDKYWDRETRGVPSLVEPLAWQGFDLAPSPVIVLMSSGELASTRKFNVPTLNFGDRKTSGDSCDCFRVAGRAHFVKYIYSRIGLVIFPRFGATTRPKSQTPSIQRPAKGEIRHATIVSTALDRFLHNDPNPLKFSLRLKRGHVSKICIELISSDCGTISWV